MNMVRNNSRMTLVRNGRTRHGQFKWHNADCQIENYGFKRGKNGVYRCIWCATHGQWAHERPTNIKHIYTFENSEVVEVKE